MFSLEPLEAPGCACSKIPCPLRGPSTSLYSSDNISPVLLTLATIPCSFQSFLCTRQLKVGHPALASHPRAVCWAPCFTPDLTTAFGPPRLGNKRRVRYPADPLGPSYSMPSSAAWMRGHFERESIVWSLNPPSCTHPKSKEEINQLNTLKLS